MADRRQRQRPLAVISRAVTGVWVVVLKAGIEWEATGIQIPFFGCGLKQINSDSTFYFVCGPLPLPPSRQPIGELTVAHGNVARGLSCSLSCDSYGTNWMMDLAPFFP